MCARDEDSTLVLSCSREDQTGNENDEEDCDKRSPHDVGELFVGNWGI